jgi:hypothetical protein
VSQVAGRWFASPVGGAPAGAGVGSEYARYRLFQVVRLSQRRGTAVRRRLGRPSPVLRCGDLAHLENALDDVWFALHEGDIERVGICVVQAPFDKSDIPQSSSASRLTTGEAGFLLLSQSGERPAL